MTTCNVKGITHNDEPAENYHPTLQIPSALQSFLASFCSSFWFYVPHLYCFGPTALISLVP